MSTISSENIQKPSISVSPPILGIVLIWVVFIAIFLLVINIPIENSIIKWLVIVLYCAVLFIIGHKQISGNYMVALKANNDGVYFQTNNYKQYYYIPWEAIGVIEKCIFPLNSRGMRFEVLGEYRKKIIGTNHIGNVVTEKERTFIYTIPQLHNREKLIS